MMRRSGRVSNRADTKNTYIILIRQSEKAHIFGEYYQESDNNIKNIPKKFLYWRIKGFDKDQNRGQRCAIKAT
jgi:hypothetical protein